jgi:hypothetical protein
VTQTPPYFFLFFAGTIPQTIVAGPGRQPGGFLYWPKEKSHQRKGLFGAALGMSVAGFSEC